MIGRKGLACREVVELVTDYLEGTLSRRNRRRFESHIAACPHCTAYLKQMKRMLDALGVIREEDIPSEMRAELIEAFRGWRTGR